MTDNHMPQFWRGRWSWLLLGFAVIAGYFLITEHAAHLAGALPWLLLAACPLMHLFGHHHGHGEHQSPPQANDRTVIIKKEG